MAVNPQKQATKLRMLITDVRHAIRLPIYNGHTHGEINRNGAD